MTTIPANAAPVASNTTAEPAPIQPAGVEVERDAAVVVARYKAGNTALLESVMDLVNQHCSQPSTEVLHHGYLSANEEAFQLLLAAGMAVEVDGGIGLMWDALEDRKPKRQTWEQAVNECVTDPVERARLLAFDDKEIEPAASQGDRGKT